ncbi:APC family permease [Catenuloplanes atrovinosus]|uniref:Amino acid transporter n=1 Tax=Catenuloplanes atrovinosus TaxID=137266 RepID=A0AAE3YQA1_9ACTN|nr:APC family permease [Catenuloplanes atrovinosus]MDR7277700.1 amino acid transporter [Catenuloplanes atrovinosus]
MTVIAGGATTQWAVTGVLGIPVAYLAVAVVLAVFFVGFLDMSRRIPNAGAFYAYIRQGLGRHLAVGGAFIAVVAYGAMQVGLYGGAGPVAATFFDVEFGWSAPWWVFALICWAVIAVMGVLRVDVNGAVLAVLLAGEILIAAVLAAVQVTHPADGVITYDALHLATLVTSGSFAVAFVVGYTGFVGVEGAAVFAEETKDPRRTVRNATFIALGLIGVLYAFCSWAMSVAAGPQHIVGRATAEGSELIFSLAAAFVPAVVITAGRLLFVTSLLAAGLAFHNAFARYIFALGREGVIPAVFAKVSPRTNAPIGGSITQSVIGLVCIGLYAIAGWDPMTHLFYWITCLAGLGVLILMAVTSVSVAAFHLARWRTRRRTQPADAMDDEPVSVVQGIIAPMIASALMAWIFVETLQTFHVLLGVDAADPVRWLLPAAFLAAGAIGVVWAEVLRRSRPAVYARIGLGSSVPTRIDPVTPLPATGGDPR